MAKAKEAIIGTFLYAASARSYEIYRLIFTTDRIIVVSLSWKKSSIIVDLANFLYFLLTFPFSGQLNISTQLMRRWNETKNQNKGMPIVDYNGSSFEEIMDMGPLRVILHEISTTPYSMLKSMTLVEDPLTDDCRLRIEGGFMNSSTYMIPGYSIPAFRELVAKTPIADKLKQ